MDCVLKPGESIKPVVQLENVENILNQIYGLKSTSVQELNGYDDKNFHVKVDTIFENKFLEYISQLGYVLKITNSLDSKEPELFGAQNALLIFLETKDVCCPKPVRNKNGEYFFITELTSGKHIVRLFEFIPGSILHSVPPSNELFYEVGKYVAYLDVTLENFSHKAYNTRSMMWQLESVPKLSQFLFAITDPVKKKVLNQAIEDFSKQVIPLCDKMEKGVIHGDFNEQNILVQEIKGLWQMKGILDFGDVSVGCYLFELAITMTYMMIHSQNLESGAYVLAGYSSIKKLPDEELKLLKVCVVGRLCQTLILGAYSSLQDPQNPYILTTAKAGWILFQKLWNMSTENLLELWLNKKV